jgi:hypothetical protein
MIFLARPTTSFPLTPGYDAPEAVRADVSREVVQRIAERLVMYRLGMNMRFATRAPRWRNPALGALLMISAYVASLLFVAWGILGFIAR